MRCEEKVPGGKLVCIELWTRDGKAELVKLTGDFFLHPEDAVESIEGSLKGIALDSDESEIKNKISEALIRSGAQLIGASAEDLARIFKKAVSGVPE